MLSQTERRVADFIKANELFARAGKVVLAVSGGADSTALIYMMASLKSRGLLRAQLLCAHINHQLRGSAAEKDEAFVIKEAGKLGLEVVTKRIDVRGYAGGNKLSIETAARELRIESLLDIAGAAGSHWIATAHQKDDNAETVVQRLIRGTGFRGLGGIWPVREFAGGVKFARPMLCLTRDDIVRYLKEKDLKWRLDHTNYDLTYRRNFIRHRLIPALERDCRSCLAGRLFDLSRASQRFYRLICREADKLWAKVAHTGPDGVSLETKFFSAQHRAVKVELVRRALSSVGCAQAALTQGHYERTLELAGPNLSCGAVSLPMGFTVRREYGKLVFTAADRKNRAGRGAAESAEVTLPGQTRFGAWLIEASIVEADQQVFERFKAKKSRFVEWFDFDRLKAPLLVAYRRRGERFWPLGLAGEKKVGKFLTAAKAPRQLREKILVISDNEKVIWIWPIRISEKVKVTSSTRRIVELRINEAGSRK